MTTAPHVQPSLLEPRDYYKPFAYPWAYQAYKTMQSMHWLPHEAPMAEDVKDWQKKLNDNEKSLLTQLFRFFTQADVDVARGYFEKYALRFQHPELRMMIGSFIAAEANHIDAYATLIDTLGLPEIEFKAFQDYAAMRSKHEYMFERNTGKGISDLAVDIAVFSAFGEGMQLFSSFALLMSFQRRGLMKGMTTIVEWSIRDESHHVESMIKLLHELIKEHPRIWNDETKQRIYQACRDMVDLEDAFIDQAFSLGGVEGVTPAEAKAYIRYIADRRLLQLGLKANYGVKENPFDWLDWIMNAPTHTNFFEQRSTEYGKGETQGWDNAFSFLKRGPLLVEGGAGKIAKTLITALPKAFVVYTMPNCPYCDKAKALLLGSDHKVEFHLIEDAEERARLKEAAKPGWRTFPLVFDVGAVHAGVGVGTEEFFHEADFLGGAAELEKVLTA
ncbi:ribonucleoside-diphosphate reductase I subunit beta [Brevundimonas phage vB_BpoS-Papperlapapp]|uniref:ribonucleoside-diphosphate reductase n=1 Tax=Brevundimonas phage vB_BpoS-Domovoi TaxID=2948598 RepID=A0A9E7SJV6_9CAUD|nr:ribonucleoside-diphosphate reductase 1 subunit beta [Brevundimonas phage vB_BpoS-Domovoi]USN16261.1 ribonucleoside-diphosphate reductase I subunit beta [Brevundimonas phage vB_BpoS-Papperlapapp]